MTFSEINFKLTKEAQTIRGLRYTNGTKNNVLCLHGWLDNANSFKPLMPLLSRCDVVAIDLPGHGLSDHVAGSYTIATNAHAALQVARSLGWSSFHLIGHSLGGCIAPFSAVADPDIVQSMTLIDAIGPKSETAQQLPARLQQYHQEMSLIDSYKSRVFDSVDQAIASRLRANKMDKESARLIVERQLIKSADGFRWRFDGKLRTASSSYYTEEQVQAILSSVSCSVQCIMAEDGYTLNYKHTEQRLQQLANHQFIKLPGHHHLHLDTPQPVAAAINEFLS